MNDPSKEHSEAVNRILQYFKMTPYIKMTPGKGLFLKKTFNRGMAIFTC